MKISLIGDWGGSKTGTQVVANLTSKIMAKLAGRKLQKALTIENNPRSENPIAYFEPKNNDYHIGLACESGSHWCQIIYQLAHETCHLHCNYSLAKFHKHKWLEESLCEAASIAVLLESAKQWKSTKLQEDYSKHIYEYVRDIRSKSTTGMSQEEFEAWLAAKICDLEKSSTQRELNRTVAFHLYDSLFAKEPSAWQAITLLNTWECHKDKDTNSFLASWQEQLNKNNINSNGIIEILKQKARST